jgi:hypothetical protein
MLRTIRLGLLAGVVAGFLAALLYVVDYGPGNSLHGVARWFALDSQVAGKFIGFLLMLVLGAVFGILFGTVMGKRQVTLGRSLGVGLLLGFIWWVVVAFFLGIVINHLRFNLQFWLATFVPLLVYGLLLGSISYRWRIQQA